MSDPGDPPVEPTFSPEDIARLEALAEEVVAEFQLPAEMHAPIREMLVRLYLEDPEMSKLAREELAERDLAQRARATLEPE
jgi:transposase